MPTTIKYIGTQDRWPELAVTGKQSMWRPGQQEERSDLELSLLLATGLFNTVPRNLPTVYPSRAVAEITYPASANLGREIVVGSGSLVETRKSNGKHYAVINAGPIAAARAVATNGSFPNYYNTTPKNLQCRRMHTVRSRVKQIKGRLVNKYVDPTTFAEASPGAASTYSIGLVLNGVNIGSLRLAGNTSMAVADGAWTDTDYLDCDLYPGDILEERFYMTNAVGCCYEGDAASSRPAFQDAAAGEMCQIAAGLTDQTTGTGALTGAANYNFAMGGCFALIGVSTDPAIMIIGDSEEVGIGEAYTGSAVRGAFARSIAPYFAFSKVARGGDGALKYVASHAIRGAMGDIFTHIVCNYGINDINNFAQTSAQVLANLQTIRGYFPGVPFFLRTLTPASTSTDLWKTTDGQTVGINNTTINAFNNLIRPVPAGFAGCFEYSDPLSTARDSGIWIANGGTPQLYTQDGLHLSAVASELVKSVKAFKPELIVVS